MHKLEYPQSAIDFIMHRRGKLHIYEALDPAKTALIVVDMQSAFVAEGAAIETPAAREIVPNINRLAAACRAAGAMLFKHGGAHDIFIHKGYMLFCDTFGSPDWQNNPGGRLYFAGRAVDEAFFGQLPGYVVRGLAGTEDEILLGHSKHSHREGRFVGQGGLILLRDFAVSGFVQTPFSQVYDIMRTDGQKFDAQENENAGDGLEELMEREIGPPAFRDRDLFVTDPKTVPPLVYPRTLVN